MQSYSQCGWLFQFLVHGTASCFSIKFLDRETIYYMSKKTCPLENGLRGERTAPCRQGDVTSNERDYYSSFKRIWTYIRKAYFFFSMNVSMKLLLMQINGKVYIKMQTVRMSRCLIFLQATFLFFYECLNEASFIKNYRNKLFENVCISHFSHFSIPTFSYAFLQQ